MSVEYVVDKIMEIEMIRDLSLLKAKRIKRIIK